MSLVSFGHFRDHVGSEVAAAVLHVANGDGMPRQSLGLIIVEHGDLILLTVGGPEDHGLDIAASPPSGLKSHHLIAVGAEGHGGGLQLGLLGLGDEDRGQVQEEGRDQHGYDDEKLGDPAHGRSLPSVWSLFIISLYIM